MGGKELERITHDDMLERLVLGAVLTDHKQLEQAMGTLAAEDFFHPDYRAIFKTAQSLRDRGKSLNIVELYDEIDSLGDLEGRELFQPLGISDKTPTSFLKSCPPFISCDVCLYHGSAFACWKIQKLFCSTTELKQKQSLKGQSRNSAK